MVANIRGYTTNYNFKLINFDTPRWHTLEYANWELLDALLKQAYIPTIRGEWVNSTDYIAGDRVIDPDSGEIFRCEVAHTSAATPTTFLEDRAANPTFWVSQVPGVPVYRGPWAPMTVYAQGDIAEVGNYDYYLCNVQHTSTALFADNASKWTQVFSASNVVLDAQASADAAAASEAAAAISEANAAASAAAAAASEADAEAAAQAAEDAQGAFRWNFDDGTTASDPGISNMRFNNAVVASATSLILSAQTADITNPDISAWIVTWDDSTNAPTKGTIYVRKVAAAQIFAVLELTGTVVDNGTWLEVGVTVAQNAGLFFDGEPVSISFIRTGNQGSSGAGTGDMLAANNLNDVDNIPASRTNLGVGDTSTPTFAQVSIGVPTVPTNAATKQYVDAATTAANDAIALKVAKAGDTMSGALVLSGAPVLPLHAATRQYVDDGDTTNAAAITAGDALKVNRAGDVMTGHLTLPINPLDANAVRKDYVDAADAAVAGGINNKVSKSGDTMTGLLTLSSAPTADLHATTKLYTDGKVAKTGDHMTGALTIGGATAPSPPPQLNSLLCDQLSSKGGFVGFNGYVDNAGGWRAAYAGYVGAHVFNSTAGAHSWYRSTTTTAAGAVPAAMANLMQLESGGVLRLGGGMYFSTSYMQDFVLFGEPGTDIKHVSFGSGYEIWGSPANTQVKITFATGYYMMCHAGGAGSFQVNVQAYKPGGGAWVDNSDARIKNVVGSYSRGLDAVTTLNPVLFTFKGNDTMEVPGSIPQTVLPGEDANTLEEDTARTTVPYPDSLHYHAAVNGTQFAGLIAQEVEPVFPEMVKQRIGYIDGVAVTDLRDVDTTPLIFALVNATKELKTRLEALEAGRAVAVSVVNTVRDAIHDIPTSGALPARFDALLTQMNIMSDALVAMLEAEAP